MPEITNLADFVKETTTTTGNGTLNLAGAVAGHVGFVAGVGTGAIIYYGIRHQTTNEWEVGIGTVTDASPDTLSRTTILASSNAGAAVVLTAGTKDVYITHPMGRSLIRTHANPTSDKNTGLHTLTHFEQLATINGTKDVFTMLPDPGVDEAGLFEFIFQATLNGTANIAHSRLFKLHVRWVGGAASTGTLQTAAVVSGGASFSVTVGITAQALVLTLTDDVSAPQTVNVQGWWTYMRHNEAITP